MKTPTTKTRNAALELNLTSMIDVIFLLLIFFVFTSDFKEPEKLLPTKLSAVGLVDAPLEQQERDLGKITVRVAASPDGALTWTVDGARVESLAAVEETLAALQEIDPTVPVVLALAVTNLFSVSTSLFLFFICLFYFSFYL